jgi:glycosyltransferase involved in cell wall biosynthesis
MLCKQYNVLPENIYVVPHSIAPVFSDRRKEKDAIERIKMRFGITSDYIMYHGGFRPYKNVSKVIESYNAYRRSGGLLKLCLAGKRNSMFAHFIQPVIDRSPFKHEIHSIGYVPDEELSYLLSGAKCFLYLSKMEGFGYAPLEAMACGVPVICSRNTSLIENLSDNTYWVEDNESTEEIANKIIKISNDSGLSDHLINKGLRIAAEFSDRRFRLGMKNVYIHVANMPP